MRSEKKHASTTCLAIAILLVPLAWIGCIKKKTDADVIREKVAQMVTYMEREKIEDLFALIADEYTDAENRGKKETRIMIEEYFNRFNGIVIHLLDTTCQGEGPVDQIMETEALLSQGAAMALRRLAQMTGRYYKFKLHWRKLSGEWKLLTAEWIEIDRQDLTEKAVDGLNKLIPD